MSSSTNRTAVDPIAVVGIGCRFPGGANSPDAYWDLMINGRDAIGDVPEDRWNIEKFFSPDANKPAKMYVRKGGFLRESPQYFDASFFGISPREAVHMDPQQRLLLEVAWEAMEDAGIVPATAAGSNTGVYVGGFTLDSLLMQMSPLNRDTLSTHSATGGSMTMLANRLSYFFDLRGPSVSIDTACSSSLVAIHYACQSLWRGECSLAVAGGANIMLRPEYPIVMSKGHFLAPDGHCKSFDERANGYSRGEGVGVVLLKPLLDALRDADEIYALVRGTGVNQDGRTEGITVPNPDSQEALIRQVYGESNVPLNQVRYIEAHGTGTAVGDPIEATVLGKTVGADREASDPCVIGSVKANIGHLEAAAGIAGFIKACLCLHHRRIPPLANLNNPNPNIPFEAMGLRLPRRLEPIEAGEQPAYVGVNSFGYGGTNGHAILQEAPTTSAPIDNEEDGEIPRIFTVSARDQNALTALAQAYVSWQPQPSIPLLRDVCYSANVRRSHHNHRLAVVADTFDGLMRELQAYVDHGRGEHLCSGRVTARKHQKPVFVFTGMGPQWWGMGHELLETEPVFRQASEAVDTVFKKVAGWSILDEMGAEENRSRIGNTEIAQPANFLLQVALMALLESWGIHPSAIVGHSVGEVSAAYAAGVLDLEDAVRVSFHRSRLQQQAAGKGKMMATGLTPQDADTLIAGYEDRISVAAINGPSAVTLSGDPDALSEIAAELERKGTFNRLLQVEVPYHSPHMESLKPEMRRSLRDIRSQPPTVSLYSTVTGCLADGMPFDAEYWCDNIRRPVLFADAVANMIEQGYATFLEIGPHPVLSASIKDAFLKNGVQGKVFSCLRREKPERATMLMALGGLYADGYEVDWSRLCGAGAHHVKLPAYPWQRERYWSESEAAMADRTGRPDHPLLGMRLQAPSPTWESDLNPNYAAYLEDHVVEKMTVFPAAGYIEQGLAIRSLLQGGEAGNLEDLEFRRALVIDPGKAQILRLVYDDESQEFRVYSQQEKDSSDWALHAQGRLSPAPAFSAQSVDLAAIRQRCEETVERDALYARLDANGLQYGPSFQRIQRLWRGTGEVLAELEPECQTDAWADAYHLHPTLMDASIQSLVAILDDDGKTARTYLPASIRRVCYRKRLNGPCWSYGRLTKQTKDRIEGDIVLCDAQGDVLAELLGLCCKALATSKAERADWLARRSYGLNWERAERDGQKADPKRWLVLSDQGGVGGSLAQKLRSGDGSDAVEMTASAVYGHDGDRPPGMGASGPALMTQALDRAEIGNCQGIVYLWAIDTSDSDADPTSCEAMTGLLHLVQSLARAAGDHPPRLYVVTQGAQLVDPEQQLQGLAQASVVGLARATISEHPELRCTVVDLAQHDGAAEAVSDLLEELLFDSPEDDIALRPSGRFVHRLCPLATGDSGDGSDEETGRPPIDGDVYALEVGTPGRIESLRFREMRQKTVDAGEVEIRIHAAAVNFKDVMKALGILPEKALDRTFHATGLGMEAAGIITRVGDGVQEYRVGDEVVASIRDSFSSHVIAPVDEMFAVNKLDDLSFVEAASIPVIFMTAYYALQELARLRKGETVLIHAAAGGVGMAAIQVAKWLDATIIATAGSDEKRAYVHSLGVEHVLDSRSLAFADQIMTLTDGRGVDVVLNSLSGEAQLKSLSIVAPLGRFIEIGKRDIVENGRLPMLPFNRNLSFLAIDLDRIMVEQPALIRRLLNDVWERFRAGDFVPTPITMFSPANISDAFRHMSQSKQIGKIVISMEDQEALSILPVMEQDNGLDRDGSYLVTGGFGGFGLEVAKWLVREGAHNLVLVGRNGAKAPEAQEAVRLLEEQGVSVMTVAADMAREDQVAGLLTDIAQSMPPLKGIIHAAAVLDDAMLCDLDEVRIQRVMAPKAWGAWFLHKHSQTLPLDFFVLFSSVSSLVGNPGQANYVAANLFLDSLAQYRQGLGLPATSINWGALGEVGMVARSKDIADHLARVGINALRPVDAMDALSLALQSDSAQFGFMDVDWTKWRQFHPAAATSPKFSRLLTDENGGDRRSATAEIRATLLAAESKDRLEILAGILAELVAETSRMPTDKVDIYMPLTDMGIDSLMAVELQFSINMKFGIELSVLELIKGYSLVEMASELMSQMDVPFDQGEPDAEDTSLIPLQHDADKDGTKAAASYPLENTPAQ